MDSTRRPVNNQGAGMPTTLMMRDTDVVETQEWLQSLDAVLQSQGPSRARFLLGRLIERGLRRGLDLKYSLNTPYVNTIPPEEQPPFPGERAIERRIKSLIRWNAMAMVVRANRKSEGIGGHISTYASAATLLEVGLNHYFKSR